MSAILDAYLKSYAHLEGWFSKEHAIIWDYLLSFQKRAGVAGGVMEIGIWGGKSATLLAMHATATEAAVFADLEIRNSARNAIEKEHPEGTFFFEGRSSTISGPADIGNVKPEFRFIHIDGGHTGTEITHDLKLADSLLGERGIICVDDFFSPQYPQLTDAIFRYIGANPYSLSLIMVGLYKGFLVRPIAARDYLAEIDKNLFETFQARKCYGLNLCKTTYPDELNCFGIHWSNEDRGKRIGPDWDRETLTF